MIRNIYLKGKKVLIIEDDPDHVDLILDAFEIEDVGNEVILMKDGQDVIDYLQETGSSATTVTPDRSGGDRPFEREQAVQSDIKGGDIRHSQIDLIILDLNLPKVNGMDILKFLKRNSRYCSIPVVILSTSSDQDTILEAYKNGANGYVTKPISYDEFVDKIRLLRRYWSDTKGCGRK